MENGRYQGSPIRLLLSAGRNLQSEVICLGDPLQVKPANLIQTTDPRKRLEIITLYWSTLAVESRNSSNWMRRANATKGPKIIMSWRDLIQWRTYDPSLYAPSETLQRNEKIKAISTFANNAGLALLVAGVARWFDPAKDLDEATVAALCSGTLGVTISVAICSLLKEVERQ